MKLALSPDIRRLAKEIVAPLQSPEIWKAMGLSYAKNPYAIIRMEGVTGSGKTALANYMARQLKQPPMHLDFARIASDQLGGTEQAINLFFDTANETKTKTLIMEECDALVWSRNMVDKDTTYHQGFVAELLRRIDEFKNRDMPSMLIMTTNHPERIDAAIESRITDVLRIPIPTGDHAHKVWMTKLPECLLKTIQDGQLEALARLHLTPRAMENLVLQICRRAAVDKRLPVFADFGISPHVNQYAGMSG